MKRDDEPAGWREGVRVAVIMLTMGMIEPHTLKAAIKVWIVVTAAIALGYGMRVLPVWLSVPVEIAVYVAAAVILP